MTARTVWALIGIIPIALILACSSPASSSTSDTAINDAITWALNHNHQSIYNQQCLAFVTEAYAQGSVAIGSIGNSNGAAQYWATNPKKFVEHPNNLSPPVGALVFWGPTPAPYANPYGHVGIYLGNNTVISSASWPENSTGTAVHEFSFSGRNSASDGVAPYSPGFYPYLGWIAPTSDSKSSPPSGTAGHPTSVDTSPTLAVGTRKGMVVWSKSKGAVSVGPVSALPVDVVDINWSQNGEYLAWEQLPIPNNSARTKVFELNVLTHRTFSWKVGNAFLGGLVPGPTGVVASEVTSTQFTVFSSNGSVRRFNTSLPVLAAPAAYRDGFLATEAMFASYDPTATDSPIVRVTTKGAVNSTAANLPLFPANYTGPEYGIAAASPNGDDLAVELGDHTDVCGVGPSSVVITANVVSGSVKTLGPPTPSGGAVLRVSTLSWSPTGVLDATMYRCGAPTGGSDLATELWEDAGTSWRRIGTDVLYVDRGPKEILATVSGYFILKGTEDGPNLAVSGSQTLKVGGARIALHAPAGELAWAP